MLTRFFPNAMLNFDVPPPGAEIGPLHAVFTEAGKALMRFSHDLLLLHEQVCVTYASGSYLDAHGLGYGVLRLPNELDPPFRVRILEAMRTGKLTLDAIATAVRNYYASTRGTAAQPTVTTYDLQSNPALAAQYGLVRLQFVISIDFPIDASLVFFAGRSYAGRNSYVIDPNAVSIVETDAGLIAVVTRTKAAGTQPIYQIRRFIR
jgi:hypothetical protein